MTEPHRRTFLMGATAAFGLAGSAARAQTAAPAPAPPSGPFKLDPLPYPPAKNEPTIDARTMELHHGRHHQAFVTNLNVALASQAEIARMPLNEILANLGKVPEAIRTTVRNSGGGHANHTMYWQIMGGSGGAPKGEVGAAIDRDFGGAAKMMEDFNAAGARVFGSGWVFVTVGRDGKLALVSKPNQDSPLMDGQMVLFGNDVWEHAYYLTYQNRRPDYLKAWWNVVNWDKVAERYEAAKAGRLTI